MTPQYANLLAALAAQPAGPTKPVGNALGDDKRAGGFIDGAPLQASHRIDPSP